MLWRLLRALQRLHSNAGLSYGGWQWLWFDKFCLCCICSRGDGRGTLSDRFAAVFQLHAITCNGSRRVAMPAAAAASCVAVSACFKLSLVTACCCCDCGSAAVWPACALDHTCSVFDRWTSHYTALLSVVGLVACSSWCSAVRVCWFFCLACILSSKGYTMHG